MRRTPLLTTALAATTFALTGALVAPAGAASASGRHADPPTPRVIADGLAGPLQLAVGPRHSVTVAQSFAGALTRIGPHGQLTDVVSAPGEEIGAVSVDHGTTTFARNTESETDFTALLQQLDSKGKVRTVADLGAYEKRVNPDRSQTYGFPGLDAACQAQLPPDFFPSLPTYRGQPYSHPYASASAHGKTYVADAGANDLLSVDSRGRVRTVAVLPAQTVRVTADAASEAGLPDCLVGKPFRYESVPTDVEIGRDGAAYVTSLPGGPESPALGARGVVYRVDLRNGCVTVVARDLLGATNLAVAPDGTLYVTELFANRITQLRHGDRRTVLEVTEPLAVEWDSGRLYFSSGLSGPGQVAVVKTSGHHHH